MDPSPALSSSFQQLRAPFAADKIGKLPRATVDRETYKKLPKARCHECGGWHPQTNTIHLDYIGHADVTDRLLGVDPEWNWEPLASDDAGLPQFVTASGRPVGLWIKLTVCGVTRLGYGSCDPSKNDAEKELIGDALRNAAMRFGVALDLWRKERPHVEEDEARPAGAGPAANGNVAAAKHVTAEQVAELQTLNKQCPAPVPDGIPWDTLLAGRSFEQVKGMLEKRRTLQTKDEGGA